MVTVLFFSMKDTITNFWVKKTNSQVNAGRRQLLDSLSFKQACHSSNSGNIIASLVERQQPPLAARVVAMRKTRRTRSKKEPAPQALEFQAHEKASQILKENQILYKIKNHVSLKFQVPLLLGFQSQLSH